jgi:hypothetical protein
MAYPDWFLPLNGPIGSGTCTRQRPIADDIGRRGARGARASGRIDVVRAPQGNLVHPGARNFSVML